LLPVLPISASGNTQYEVTQASLHWAMAAALDLHRDIAFPVPLHKGLAPSVLPSASANAYAVFAHHVVQKSCDIFNLPQLGKFFLFISISAI
jgi:cytochrome b561